MKQATGSGVRAPRRNSLRAKLLAFYADNPSAELTQREIATKFDCSAASVEEVLGVLRAEKVIQSAYVYRLMQGVIVQKPAHSPTREQLRAERRAELVRLGLRPNELPAKAQGTREWPAASTYVEPKPIAISVFEWRP